MADIRAFSAAASSAYGQPDRGGDDRLLTELLELLSHLEQHRTRLLENRTGESDPAALARVAELVNAVVEFVVAHSEDPSLLPSRVLARIADSLPYTQLLGEEDERITVATAMAVLADWKGEPRDRRRMVHDLCNASVDLLAVYCDALAGLFKVDREREEWRAMSELFVTELRTAFEDVP